MGYDYTAIIYYDGASVSDQEELEDYLTQHEWDFNSGRQLILLQIRGIKNLFKDICNFKIKYAFRTIFIHVHGEMEDFCGTFKYNNGRGVIEKIIPDKDISYLLEIKK